MRIEQSKEADWPTSPTGCALAPRDRVLKVACELFAEVVFTERTFGKSASALEPMWLGCVTTSTARRGFIEAVIMEAGRRLSDRDEDFVRVLCSFAA